MTIVAHTAILSGIEARIVKVIYDPTDDRPMALTTHGEAATYNEAWARVRLALRDILPEPVRGSVTIDADGRRLDPGVDLAIAAVVLAAHGKIDPASLFGLVFWGDLGGGEVSGRNAVSVAAAASMKLPTSVGMVTSIRGANECADAGFTASTAEGFSVAGVESIARLIEVVSSHEAFEHATAVPCNPREAESHVDFADIRGMARAVHAAELLAAGGHHMLLVGPAGVGKTMIARRLQGILPPLDATTALELAKIRSAARDEHRGPVVRMPHHTVSVQGVFGGGTPCRPGEASLAHGGVLFLDDAPEFDRGILDGLREPLEDKSITLVRSRESVKLPARFRLLLAATPCPCGMKGSEKRTCTCGQATVARYLSKLDILSKHIDLVVTTSWHDKSERACESTATIRERVLVAQARMAKRLEGSPWRCNAEVHLNSLGYVSAFFVNTLELRHVLDEAPKKAVRIALTLADLEDREPTVDDIVNAEDWLMTEETEP